MVLAVALLLLGLFFYAGVQTAAQSYRLRQHEREVFTQVQELRRQQQSSIVVPGAGGMGGMGGMGGLGGMGGGKLQLP